MVWKHKPVPQKILLDIVDQKNTEDHLQWDRTNNKGCLRWLIAGGWTTFENECWKRANKKKLEITSIGELKTLIRDAVKKEALKVIPITKMFTNLDSYGDCVFQVGDGVELRCAGLEAVTGQIKGVSYVFFFWFS